MTKKTIRVISATKLSEQEFWSKSWLGRSLLRFEPGTVSVSVHANNRGERARGLGSIYNQYLAADYRSEILLFVHDDVWLHDVFLPARLNDALQIFDVVGVAGNTDPQEPAVSWAHMAVGSKVQWQEQRRLSGAVAHGRTPFSWKSKISWYGESPAACKLIDGVFIAANAEHVIDSGVRFDETFRFHFYDLDFSRQCTSMGLKLGTWPIAICHASGGAFLAPEWVSALDVYLRKWHGEAAGQIAANLAPLSRSQRLVSRSRILMSLHGRWKQLGKRAIPETLPNRSK